jgi:undecaprenyl pyrophosphate synthase
MGNFAPDSKPPMSASVPALLDKDRLPRHIAIIMDGNGRWAKDKGEDRLFGHYHGVESVRDIVEGAAELGIQYLTLYVRPRRYRGSCNCW